MESESYVPLWGDESIPGTELHRLAGRYDNPIPTWFLAGLAPIAALKLPAQLYIVTDNINTVYMYIEGDVGLYKVYMYTRMTGTVYYSIYCRRKNTCRERLALVQYLT